MRSDILDAQSIYYIIYCLFGTVTVIGFARQQFNKPSFPEEDKRDILPHAVEPLRHLFLGESYRRARRAYVRISLLLYLVLLLPGLLPGRNISAPVAAEANVPLQAWPLFVALVLVGLIPNWNAKWITAVEETTRRIVQNYFLVPEGIKGTIRAVADAAYDPPVGIRNLIQDSSKANLLDDLGQPTESLDYKWARASIVLESLRRKEGALQGINFGPFLEDYQGIRYTFKELEPEVEKLRDDQLALSNDRANPTGTQVDKSLSKREADLTDREETLKTSVQELLKRMYAYLSWGILQQAKTDKEVDRIFRGLGFRIPVVVTLQIFDAAVPAMLIVCAITFLFWTVCDYINTRSFEKTSDGAVSTLFSAIAAASMYGLAISIALKNRWARIENHDWNQTYPSSYLPIARKAGLVSWAVIAMMTVLSEPGHVAGSLIGIWNRFVPDWAIFASSIATQDWYAVPVRILSAFPWVLAGAVASTLLAFLLGYDARRTGMPDRVRDGLVFGFALGVAASFAMYFQSSLTGRIGHLIGDVELAKASTIPLGTSFAVGLAGSLCGVVIGYKVPWVHRYGVANPTAEIAQSLDALTRNAQKSRPDEGAAKDWVFSPHNELGGISPAEALQHKSWANTPLLKNETSQSEQKHTQRSLRLATSAGRISDRRST
jgi:hypothetical protein